MIIIPHKLPENLFHQVRDSSVLIAMTSGEFSNAVQQSSHDTGALGFAEGLEYSVADDDRGDDEAQGDGSQLGGKGSGIVVFLALISRS